MIQKLANMEIFVLCHENMADWTISLAISVTLNKRQQQIASFTVCQLFVLIINQMGSMEI
jgi:hypothetical protein